LRYIGENAFFCTYFEKVVLPASVSEIHPFAFRIQAWKIATWDGPPEVMVRGDFLCSSDSKTLFGCSANNATVMIPPDVEVIGSRAFPGGRYTAFQFASGTRVREFREEAFCRLNSLKAFTVPMSVEIIGDRCFESCPWLEAITFEESSRLRRIGEGAFLKCRLMSIAIPASVEEIDGSAFVGCPLYEIRVAQESQNFRVAGTLLSTADGTQIVRCFGREREIVVAKRVEVLGKSCFEACSHIERVVFESDSKLRLIGSSALAGCEIITSIAIPAAVEMIDESAFRRCLGLEECLMTEDANLVGIGKAAFAGCCSLRSFGIPRNVHRIGSDCFNGCCPLHRLRFGSGESVKKIVGDRTLDEALDHFGFNQISCLFRIEVNHSGSDLDFPGWVSVGDSDSTLVLAQHDC
jgi:hypothetical protein